MINGKIQEALNQRVQDELYAWYLYLAMAAYLETQNLRGFAQWMKAQAGEEMKHAMKNVDFIIARGGTVALQAIPAPATRWDSVAATVEAAYAHEQKVTKIYHQFMDLVLSEKDHASTGHVQWFVDEQIEEEGQILDVLNKVKMAGNSSGALLALDHQFGKRAV